MSLDYCNFTVKVAGGSGCLIQPVNRDYYYVLTAKHVIKERTKEEIEVVRLLPDDNEEDMDDGNEGVKEDKFEVLEIYPHQSKNSDASVLKVRYVKESGTEGKELNAEGLKQLLLLNKQTVLDDKTEYYLTGHPKSRRGKKYSYRQNKLEISQKAGNWKIEVKLEDCPDFDEVEGQSGGGIIKKVGDEYYLAGILTKMAAEDTDEVLGRVELMPVSFFERIVKKQGDRFRNSVLDGTSTGNNSQTVKAQSLKQLISELDRAVHSLAFASFVEKCRKNRNNKNPLVSIIWGRDADAPEVLRERLENEIPGNLKKNDSESSENENTELPEPESYKLACEWQKFSDENYLDEIFFSLRFALGGGKMAMGEEAFEKHLKDPRSRHRPFVIYSKFNIKDEHTKKFGGAKNLIRDLRHFFKFWDEHWIDKAFAPERPVFIFLILEHSLPKNDSWRSWIYNKDNLKKIIDKTEEHYNLKSRNLRVKVIPELKSIKIGEVVEFVENLEEREDFSDSPETIRRLIDLIKQLNIKSEISFGDIRDKVILGRQNEKRESKA